MLSIHFIMYKPNICTYKHIHMISKWNHCFIDNKSTPMPSENTHTHTHTHRNARCGDMLRKVQMVWMMEQQVIVHLSTFRTCHMLIRCYTLSFFKMCTYPLLFCLIFAHSICMIVIHTIGSACRCVHLSGTPE